jgi:hypothetical protein
MLITLTVYDSFFPLGQTSTGCWQLHSHNVVHPVNPFTRHMQNSAPKGQARCISSTTRATEHIPAQQSNNSLEASVSDRCNVRHVAAESSCCTVLRKPCATTTTTTTTDVDVAAAEAIA